MIYNYPYSVIPNYNRVAYKDYIPTRQPVSARNFNPYSSKKAPLKEERINKKNEDTTSQTINLFGIELHFDDILLVCVLLFLYNEKVNDSYLMIALIMLLLG